MRRGVSFLKWCAVVVASVMVLYVVWRLYENHLGTQAWQRSFADLKQRGEPSDWTELIPPAVPDADNLGALPLLQYSYAPGQKVKTPAALDAALSNIVSYDSEFPKFDWTRGKPVDKAAVTSYLAACWRKAFPGKLPPATALGQFDALCPALGQLRSEAATHSVCRLEQDYTSEPAFDRPLSLSTDMIKLAKAANLHAELALEAGQPDLALQDLNLMLKIDDGLRKQPTLVSGLVAIGVLAIELNGVWQGLENHAWNDAQLTSLERELGAIDFLPDYQLCMRGEGLGFFAPMMTYLRNNQETATKLLFAGWSLNGDMADRQPPTVLKILWKLTPPGSLDLAAAKGVTFYTRAAREGVDVSSHRIHPDACQALKKKVKDLSYLSLPNILLKVSTGPVIGSASAFGAGQFNADAARIACMVERYRLGHGFLPSKLGELAAYSDNGSSVPHDLCNGEALHYVLRADGTYLLYSVGWNQLNDQGQTVMRTDFPKSVDRESGDWVWPQPGHPGI
jgi:hypothetical protein